MQLQDRTKRRRPSVGVTGWVLKFLASARVGHLATSTKGGTPLVVPICFVYRDATFYSAIDQKPKRTGPFGLRRVLNIVENPEVSLVVDDYNEDWKRLRYVIAHGEATILTEGHEHRVALSMLRRKYRQYRHMKLENRPIIKIKTLRTITWRATPSTT